MKVVSCTILHYGAEWLYWALRSVRPHVDEMVVSYTPFPSHSHATDVSCPESEDDLRACVEGLDVQWHTATQRFPHEGVQREHAVDICRQRGADIVLVVDADEVWDAITLQHALKTVCESPDKHRSWRVPMHHFWRSTNWVCRDPAMPTRLLDLHSSNPVDGYIPHRGLCVHHFGYAQSSEIVEYKWRIHGHKNEMRPRWFEDKFLAWDPTRPAFDLHPTNKDFWNPASYDRSGHVHLIGDHPYFHMDKIE